MARAKAEEAKAARSLVAAAVMARQTVVVARRWVASMADLPGSTDRNQRSLSRAHIGWSRRPVCRRRTSHPIPNQASQCRRCCRCSPALTGQAVAEMETAVRLPEGKVKEAVLARAVV